MKNICISFLLGFLFCIMGPYSLRAQEGCIDEDQIDLSVPCTGDSDPVCGCDGVTYVNACQAENWYGVTEWTAGPCVPPNECQADFIFAYLPNLQAVFYNNSVNYTSHYWEIEGQTLYSDPDGTLHYTFSNSAPTLVCLTITNDEGCEDSECIFVYPDAPEEMCNITDCVWPGDANGNWHPNNYDLLNIGLAFNSTGPARPFFPNPDDPIAWAPNYSDIWGDNVHGIDFKHFDCDGNGVVDEDDIDAIYHNYDPEINTETNPQIDAPELWLEFDTDLITIDLDSPSEIEITATLGIGSTADPVTDLHGLAFTVGFPDSLTYPNTTTLNYLNNSFFGYNYDVLTVSREVTDFFPGRFDGALSRKSGQGIDGSGPLAKISFIVNSDIIGGRAVPETPFDVILDNVIMINSVGDTLSYNLATNPASIIFLNAGISNSDETNLEQQLRVFPNPAKDQLTVDCGGANLEVIRILNHLGQQVFLQRAPEPTTRIDTRQWSPGIYFLEAISAEGRSTRKVVIEP